MSDVRGSDIVLPNHALRLLWDASAQDATLHCTAGISMLLTLGTTACYRIYLAESVV